MQSSGMNPIVRAILLIAFFFAISLGFDFVRQVVIAKEAFSPAWAFDAILSVVLGISAARGYDAAKNKQGDKNRK